MVMNTPHSAKARSSRTGSEQGRLLVVEDELHLQELLQYRLGQEGYTVACASTGEEGLKAARANPPDLILLDLMLPGMDGLEVCHALRRDEVTAHVPVIMVTARGEESDVIKGLEMGADDYVVKPFSPKVVAARVKAVLRRKAAEAVDEDEGNAIRREGLLIDLDRHEVRIDDEPVTLTITEFRLLELLAARPGRVFTRQQIIEHLHGSLAAVTDRSVDVQVVGLRRKLGSVAERVKTVRGVGYRFQE